MRISPTRSLLAVAVTGLAVVMAAGPVAAHPEGEGEGHRGKVGRHAFVDSETRPGARCIYSAVEPTTDKVSVAAAELAGVAVRPPKVAAINRTDRVDRGLVAWRFILQEKVGDGDWTKVKRSRLQVRRTTDHRAAKFSRLKVRYDGNPEAEYRVKTKAFWLKARRHHRGVHVHAIGAASHVVDYYRIRGEVVKASCPGGIPAPAVS